MVEYKTDETHLTSRRAQLPSTEESSSDENMAEINQKKPDKDMKSENENEAQGFLGRVSGSVYNTTKYAAGSAYGGVTWVAGGVWSTTGTAIGATYNTVSSLSPLTLFTKKSGKSKSD